MQDVHDEHVEASQDQHTACSALKQSWCEREALIELLWRVVDRGTWRGSDLGKSVVCRQVRKLGFFAALRAVRRGRNGHAPAHLDRERIKVIGSLIGTEGSLKKPFRESAR